MERDPKKNTPMRMGTMRKVRMMEKALVV